MATRGAWAPSRSAVTGDALRSLGDAVPADPARGVAMSFAHPHLVGAGRVRMLLSREPGADESNVRHLVHRATAAFDIEVVPRAEDLPIGTQPLWPTDTVVQVESNGRIVGEAQSRTRRPITVHAALDRSDSLRLLDDLFGTGDHLRVLATVWYRSTGGLSTVRIRASLRNLVGPGAAATEVTLFVDRVGEWVEVSRRRHDRARAARRRTVGRPETLARAHGLTASVGHAFLNSPQSHSAHAVLASHAGSHLTNYIEVDDLRIAPPAEALPLVNTPRDPAWPDANDPTRGWYPSAFELDTAADDPFRFEFRRTGVDQAGRPALDGEIIVQVRSVKSAASTAAIDAAEWSSARPVPMSGLGAQLGIPFVDSTTGEATVHYLDGVMSEESANRFTISFPVVGDWVRLAYGSLAIDGFQSSVPELSVAYRFTGAVRVKPQQTVLAFGAKEVGLRAQGVSIDPNRLTVKSDGHRLASFSKERRRQGSVAAAAVALRPAVVSALSIRPLVTVAEPVEQVTATRSFIRRSVTDLVMPCTSNGHRYRELGAGAGAGESTAIGCADALALGTVRYRLFTPLPDLSTPSYTVDRAVQQPHRVLITPSRYRIGRRHPDHENAFDPVILLYAHLDVDDPAASRVVLSGQLEPDVIAADVAEVRLSARTDAGAAVDVVFPHQLDHADVEWQWTVSVPDTEIEALVTPDGIRFTLSTTVAFWELARNVLEHSGIVGVARFELSDGSVVTTSLEIDLRHLTGPLDGAVVARAEADTVTFENHLEVPVAIPTVLRMGPDGTWSRHPVELVVAAGESAGHRLDDASGTLLPDYRPEPTGPIALDEIRSFVEDVETEIGFVNTATLANRNVARIVVDVRIKDEPGLAPTQRLVLDDDTRHGTVGFLMPITRYLANPILQYRVTSVAVGGAEEVDDWLDWDIVRSGVVITLTWNSD